MTMPLNRWTRYPEDLSKFVRYAYLATVESMQMRLLKPSLCSQKRFVQWLQIFCPRLATGNQIPQALNFGRSHATGIIQSISCVACTMGFSQSLEINSPRTSIFRATFYVSLCGLETANIIHKICSPPIIPICIRRRMKLPKSSLFANVFLFDNIYPSRYFELVRSQSSSLWIFQVRNASPAP